MTPVFASEFRARIARCILPLVAAAAVAACSDSLAPKADQTNVSQSFTAAALTGSATNAPAALNLVNKAITRIDGGFDFDLAFDLNAQGNAVLLPLGLVGTPLAGAHLVGLQRLTGSFDNAAEAPKSGYVFDSTMVVGLGQVVAVQAQESMCSLSLTPYIFAKVVIDSVSVPQRKLYGRTLINLNCGFRSLAPGTPSF
jgi:hypothetical protein